MATSLGKSLSIMIFDVYLAGKELANHDFRMATSLGKSLSIMIFDVYLVGNELVDHDFRCLPHWERACQ